MIPGDFNRLHKGRLIIDCSDFMKFFIKKNGVTGIQRLVLCMMEIWRRDQRVVFARYNSGRFEELIFPVETSVVSELQRLAGRRSDFKQALASRSVWRKIQGLIVLLARHHGLKTRPVEPREGDTFFFPGAAWGNLAAIDYVQGLKQRHDLRLVVYVHDLILIYGESFSDFKTFIQFRTFLEKVVETADQIICNSEYSRRDLERYTGFLGAAVVTLAHEFGLFDSRSFTRDFDVNQVRALVGVEAGQARPFVLCVGTIDRRKNQVSLVRAWIALSRRRPMPLLVLAGRFNGMSDDVRILLEREDCPVKVIEGPSDEDVGALYAACQFTVFPSHFEGWGIPVGESLWFGKACLASNATSIPEVGGPHCRYFDPASLDDLIEKLEGMLDDPPDMSYLTRDQLRTWEQVAQDLRLALFAPPVIPAQAAAPAEPAIPAAPHLVSA